MTKTTNSGIGTKPFFLFPKKEQNLVLVDEIPAFQIALAMLRTRLSELHPITESCIHGETADKIEILQSIASMNACPERGLPVDQHGRVMRWAKALEQRSPVFSMDTKAESTLRQSVNVLLGEAQDAFKAPLQIVRGQRIADVYAERKLSCMHPDSSWISESGHRLSTYARTPWVWLAVMRDANREISARALIMGVMTPSGPKAMFKKAYGKEALKLQGRLGFEGLEYIEKENNDSFTVLDCPDGKVPYPDHHTYAYARSARHVLMAAHNANFDAYGLEFTWQRPMHIGCVGYADVTLPVTESSTKATSQAASMMLKATGDMHQQVMRLAKSTLPAYAR